MRILIISSDYTGNGHKSVKDALVEQLAKFQDINVDVVDGFKIAGFAGRIFGRSYGFMTRNAPWLWKLTFAGLGKKPSWANRLAELTVGKRLISIIRALKPDLVVSVHPAFVGSVLTILGKSKLEIPFVTLICDLVTIAPLWIDSRASFILCPTKEAAESCLQHGVHESKIILTGFPVRERFRVKEGAGERVPGKNPVFLLMSGGEGSTGLESIAEALLTNFAGVVRILAGKSAHLKQRLERNLANRFPQRVEVIGFIDNVQDLMQTSDLGITRGSPNTVLEAVACGLPVVITGALPGQEKGNPEYFQAHNLGVVVENTADLVRTVQELLANNCLRLEQIRHSQAEFHNSDGTLEIAQFLVGIETNLKKLTQNE